jgi:preprotein translocase subunit SecA
VSIGLEAYAQRDPLVQYKNRAFGLFQELLSNMRLAVVSRMFTYRPREIASMQVSQPASETNQAETIPEQSLDTISEDEEDESDEVETVAVASTDSKNISTAGVGQPGVGKRKRRRRR